MNAWRRLCLVRLGLLALAAPARGVRAGEVPAGDAPAGDVQSSEVHAGRVLAFPRDHGAHLGARIEWWYATGWLATQGDAPSHGFQVTFFRSRTGLAQHSASRFAPRHLLFAHAALTDLAARRHLHDERIARWSGAPGAVQGAASVRGGDVRLGHWRMQRDAFAWHTRVAARAFTLELTLDATQALLLQGDHGHSRKGPLPQHASHYTSEPQLAVTGHVTHDGTTQAVRGRAWLDHEWSDQVLPEGAVGWDWLGINLHDGGALTAFVLRRADGSALWAGGSHRSAAGVLRSFGPGEVQLHPGRRWRSPASGASYPVQWAVQTPVGRLELRALLDAQELDSRASTGTIYWEGLSELLGTDGQRVGLGYLEMTGYAGPLRL